MKMLQNLTEFRALIFFCNKACFLCESERCRSQVRKRAPLDAIAPFGGATCDDDNNESGWLSLEDRLKKFHMLNLAALPIIGSCFNLLFNISLHNNSSLCTLNYCIRILAERMSSFLAILSSTLAPN